MRMLFILLLFCNTCYAQHATIDSTDRSKSVLQHTAITDKLFKDYALEKHMPSSIYGLVLDGKLVYTSAAGYLDLQKQSIPDSRSVYRIASMSKSFTAMAILKLRDEKKLSLDDPVSDYIKIVDANSKLEHRITIRQLLTHAAGFPEDNPWGDRQLSVKDEEFLKFLKNGISVSTEPGTAYEYSNLGFAILGQIIKKVSGLRYQDYITKYIFQPLEMNHTYWEYSDVPAINLAHGYRWQNNNWKEESLLHDGAYGAMGGILTTMEDFAKYVALLMSAWNNDIKIKNYPVKKSSLLEMQRPWNQVSLNSKYKYPSGRSSVMMQSYGYGLAHYLDGDGRKMVGHSGGLPGFGSNWRMAPDHGLAVISFANVTYAPANFINLKLLDTILNLTNLKKSVLPSAILKDRQTQIMRVLPNWNVDKNDMLFAENFLLDYDINTLRKSAKDIFETAGKILKVHEIKPENNLRGTFIIHCERKDVEVFFTLTPEAYPKIQEFNVRLVN